MATVLLLYVQAGTGHRMAAEALAEKGRQLGHTVEIVDALSLAPSWFARAYVEAHRIGSRYTPGLYGEVFAAANRPSSFREPLRRALDRAMGERLVDFVCREAPEVVIATHFYPLTELGKLRREGRLDARLVAVVTDYVTHGFWIVPGVDLYCVAPGGAAADVNRFAGSSTDVAVTGIPVRSAFAEIPNWKRPSSGKRLRLLVTSGGLGAGPLGKIVRGCQGLAGVELDVVCGRRPALARELQLLTQRLGVAATIAEFADDMPERMARAHVVVGKSGGLTMTECLVAGRPMIVVGACPGQEVDNLETLRTWGAGRDAKAREAGRLALTWLANDDLERMAQAARARATPDAAERVFAAIEERRPERARSMELEPDHHADDMLAYVMQD
jgi:processive 1,2-diacylglycerol beta-glucosyltransferase